jgi:hypothetical protein
MQLCNGTLAQLATDAVKHTSFNTGFFDVACYLWLAAWQ